MGELTKTLAIHHKNGLHARPSTRFVELAKSFKSDVFVSRENGGQEADGKSVLEVLTLGVEMGTIITLRVNGADAEKAMAALCQLVEDDFGGL